jgi:hypothetical protein
MINGLNFRHNKSQPGMIRLTNEYGLVFLEILLRGSSRSARLLPASRFSSVGLKAAFLLPLGAASGKSSLSLHAVGKHKHP